MADGSSDAALKSIIEWTIQEHRPDLGVMGEFAGALDAHGRALDVRIPFALKLFPCDLLIVHRDAEGEPVARRLREIQTALENYGGPWIPVIPVRMTEAWLLSDEGAIRSAAENKSGRIPLNLPPRQRWENLNDPKEVLFEALRTASEKSARALRKFSPARQRALVAQRTANFAGLRGVPSFDLFEANLIEALKEL